MTRPQLLTGASATRAADALRDQRLNQAYWPYVHVFPPPDSIPVHAITLTPVAVPGVGVQVQVLQYKVPSGFSFILTGIVQQYQGGTFVFGDGLWTVDRNTPIGVASVQASPVQGLVSLPTPIGSFQVTGPWVLPRAYEFAPLDVLRSKFTEVSAPAGLLVSGFFGYLVPWDETE